MIRQRARIYVWVEQNENILTHLRACAKNLGLSLTEAATLALYFGLECLRPDPEDEEERCPAIVPWE